MATLRKIITFYTRFTPSYSAVGYLARRPFWKSLKPDFSGQTWLVTGGSEGIGGGSSRAAAEAGATVIAVARNRQKLQEFSASVRGPGTIIHEIADLSLLSEVRALLQRLYQRGVLIDVLVNNVGCMKNELNVTPEGFETSFATNLLGHYLLTRELLMGDLLAGDAIVIEVSSGGMYNHPLLIQAMNNQTKTYEGVRAYGLAKRGQVALTHYWRERLRGGQRRFYVMHPGWADTAGVKRTMPRFRAILKSILRNDAQAADTVVWLAAERPEQHLPEAIWFDRAERGVHIYAHTPHSPDTPQGLVDFLEAHCSADRASGAGRNVA